MSWSSEPATHLLDSDPGEPPAMDVPSVESLEEYGGHGFTGDEPPDWDALDERAPAGRVVQLTAGDPLAGLLERATADPAAAFAPAVLAALAQLKASAVGEFEALLGKLKAIKVGITPLRQEVAKAARAAMQGSRVADIGPWAEGLEVDGQGRPLGYQCNALHALRKAPELAGMVKFDEFALATVFARSPPWARPGGSWTGLRNWTDTDDMLLAEWLQRAGIPVKDLDAGKAAETVAREQPFHPIREYLEGQPWDGVSRVDRWLSTYAGARDSEYARNVGPRWLVSAVARVMKPGAQVDTTLILEGAQGTGKSSVFAVLGGEWFTDRISDLTSKDAAQEMAGVWIVEIAELAVLRRSGTNDAKSFLTRRSDRYRPAYARKLIDVPRQCVFGGTVNPNGGGYLKDTTGARRFWPVVTGKIDLDRLKADRDQIWAEALHLYRAGHAWWLEGEDHQALAASEAAQRQEEDPWLDRACEVVGTQVDISINEVFDAMGLELSRRDQRAQNRLAKILVSLGFERRRQSTGRREWRYVRFDDVITF